MTPKIVEALSKTKPWVRFISVLGYIGSIFMFLAGFGGCGIQAMQGGAQNIAVGLGVLVVYMLGGIFYIIPSILLGRYASRISAFLSQNSPEHLEEALMAQKSFWRYTGIMTVIGFVLAILAGVGALLIGLVAAVGRR